MFGASQVAVYSCGADANWWIERWFGDCVYTTWDTTAFFIGLSSVCFWIIAQLPQFISNFARGAADALSPWFLIQWLAGDTFNFLGCVLTGDQLKTQIITAGYFIFADIIIISQYVYYSIRNRKAVDFDESVHKGSAYSNVDFDESVHKGSAYSNVLKGNHSGDLEGLSYQDYHFKACRDNLAGMSILPASIRNDVVSKLADSNKSTVRRSSANTNASEPLDCMQSSKMPVSPALSDLSQQDGWMYEHRRRLKRLSEEYNLEYGHAFSKRLSSLYNKRKEKHRNNQPRKAPENTVSSNRSKCKAVLGIASLLGVVSMPKSQTFLSFRKSQYTRGGIALGRRALLSLHDAGAITREKSGAITREKSAQPAAAYFLSQFLSRSLQTYPWTVMIGRVLGWGSSALYLGSRLSQLIKNKQRQSAEGLSLGMLTCAVLANITYGASIIMRGPSWGNLIGKAPWLVGSFGTVFLDFSIFIQAHYYGWQSKKAEPNEYTPLLS